jgi:NAD(P) transhydrogenase subunit alpha
MSTEGRVEPDFEDEIVAGCCITHQGQIVNERVREGMKAPDPQADRAVSGGTA